MDVLKEHYLSSGATLAPDGIPLHFGDNLAEYQAALETAVLLDRSHEGRMLLTGRDRADLVNRISTNEMLSRSVGEGRATIFTNANARILDRIVMYRLDADTDLILTGPGRNASVGNYLQRNIFYADQVNLENWVGTHNQFALHGPMADQVLEDLFPGAADVQPMVAYGAQLEGTTVWLLRDKPLSGSAWCVIVEKQAAAKLWQAILDAGQPHGLLPSGGLTYNVLRIRDGQPGVGFELTDQFIPLELGLWDEVSFNKGCYTGQEIIARMESRNKLAKTLVRLKLTESLAAPVELSLGGRAVGQVTSSAQAPDGDVFAIGVVKVAASEAGQILNVADSSRTVEVVERLGVQPPQLAG